MAPSLASAGRDARVHVTFLIIFSFVSFPVICFTVQILRWKYSNIFPGALLSGVRLWAGGWLNVAGRGEMSALPQSVPG